MNAGAAIPFAHGPSEASPKRRWMWITITLLVGHTTLMLLFVFIATHDKSFAVDPDYYGKAVRWDEQQAKMRASDQLGWKFQLAPILAADGAGMRAVSFDLVDGKGMPLKQATAELTYFHRAHGQQVRVVPLLPTPSEPKRFSGSLLMPQSGMWELHLVVISGGKEFIRDEVVEAP